MVALCRLLLCLCWACAAPAPAPLARDGVLDLRETPREASQMLPLNGEWELWWGELLQPDQLAEHAPTGLLAVPGSWDGIGGGAEGYATLRLKVLLPPGSTPLALSSDALSVAHRMWINGVEVQSAGVVGTSAATEVPDVRPLILTLDEPGDALEVVLQISNFHHRVGGIRRAIELGEPARAHWLAHRATILDVGVTWTFALNGLYFLVLSQMRSRQHATLCFAVFCLDLALRASVAGSTQTLRTLLPELSWLAALRIEYVSTYLAMGLGALMMGSQFPADAWWRALRVGIILSGTFAGVALVAPVEIYTRELPLFQGTALLTLLAVVVGLVRAVQRGRPQAVFSATCLAVFCAGTVHDILYSYDLLHTTGELGSLSLVMFLLLQAWSHGREFSRSYQTIEGLSRDLMNTNTDLEATNRAVERFVPYDFLDLLKKSSIKDVQRGDHARLEMVILFCDLRGFTTLVEGLSAEAAFSFINRYLRVMEPPIHAHGGFINQYLGDCIMALFPGDTDEAIQGAVKMLAALRDWNLERAAAGEAPVRVGVGLSAGPLMIGTIGGMDRLDNGVIGDAVNRAARLEGLTKLYGTAMILDENLLRRLSQPERLALRPLDRVVLKGKSEVLRLVEVLDALPGELAERRLRTLEEFRQGVVAWERGDFSAARHRFQICLLADPDDGPARRMVERCDEELAQPTPDWPGYTTLTQK